MFPHDDDHDEDVLKVQLLSLKKVFRHFSGMDIFRNVREEDVLNEYIEIVRFASLFRFWKYWTQGLINDQL